MIYQRFYRNRMYNGIVTKWLDFVTISLFCYFRVFYKYEQTVNKYGFCYDSVTIWLLILLRRFLTIFNVAII